MTTENNVGSERALLIGGAGFIGIHTAELLCKEGYEVAIVDDFSSSLHDSLSDKHKIYELDASNIEALESVYREFKPTAVCIFSSVVDVPTTINSPLSVRSGILSLMNSAELSVKHGVNRILFASSGYVYGNQNLLPYTECANLDPVNPYNISKIFGESLLNFYSHKCGLNTAIMRYAPTYGPRRIIGPIIDFINRALSNEPVRLYGTVTRDYIYVEDVAYANLCALKKNITGAEIFNIGTGVEVTLEQVYLLICDILNVQPQDIIRHDSKGSEINRFCLDPEKAKKELDFTYAHSLREGLIKTIDWIVKKNATHCI